MDYGYLINNGGGEYELYYHSNDNLMKRSISKHSVRNTERIAENISSIFSVSVYEGIPMLVFKHRGGDVVLIRGNERRVINGGILEDDAAFGAISDNSGIRLVYMSGKRLVTRRIGKDGSEAVYLDENVGAMPFRLIPLVKGGFGLLYNRLGDGMHLGYRELTVSAYGEYKTIFSTGFDIGDSSMCVCGDIIHFAFVAMSRFSLRVMYASRSANGITRPKSLWEGSRCTRVCIAAEGCDVFVWWGSCGYIFSVISHSYGESFGQVTRRKCDSSIKALHIGCFNVSEILVSESGELYAPEEIRELTEQYVIEKEILKEENKKYAKNKENLE